jgi:hypothetical protein
VEGTDDLGWRKSSYSENGGETCVEVGQDRGTVLVRDTEQHGRGQVHTFGAVEWRAFVASVKAIGR